MQIQSQSFHIPRGLSEARGPAPQAPQPVAEAPQDSAQISNPPAESGGKKVGRVLTQTLLGAAGGALGGLITQHYPVLGTVGMTFSGMGEGGALGWHVGKRLSSAVAGSEGNPYVKGPGALAIAFGSPFVGAGAGAAAGILCASAGPAVAGAVFGGMAFVRELAR